jgi:hypothetical protein
MAKGKVVDTFANIACLTVVESAANTMTATKFAFPFSIMDKMALVINRIEWDFTAWITALAASADQLRAAITCASTVSDITNGADPLIVDAFRMIRYDMGAAASGWVRETPYIKDFSSLPGGGILVAPNPLYLMIQGASAAAAGTVMARLFYTYMELETDEYWQLVESRRIISS